MYPSKRTQCCRNTCQETLFLQSTHYEISPFHLGGTFQMCIFKCNLSFVLEGGGALKAEPLALVMYSNQIQGFRPFLLYMVRKPLFICSSKKHFEGDKHDPVLSLTGKHNNENGFALSLTFAYNIHMQLDVKPHVVGLKCWRLRIWRHQQ